MDTSEIYIGMCNCEEVQNQDCGGLYKMGTPFGDVLFYTNDKKGCSDDVWLPRQDQIQELLNDFKIYTPLVGQMLDEFYEFEGMARKEFESFERLWLSFYMSEAHNKYWNGEEWVDLEGN